MNIRYNNDMIITEIPHLQRYARVLLRDTDAAEELVQNCLERALKRYHLWQPHKRLRPWLFTIMHNLYVDSLRRPAARYTNVSLDAVSELRSHAASQEEQLNVSSVLLAIDKLPLDQRNVLILIGLDELSYAEAAIVLSIPEGTLMSRLHRARVKLRKNLGLKKPKTSIRKREQ